MNPDVNESSSPSQPDARTTIACLDWRSWVRRLLVCNPFFLCSAALLLFGVNRLSIDPNFLGEEKSNLLFNYFALQVYELLVVVTAIILARRKIWYDSALLVVMEHGLLIVPFMLINQGTFLDHALGRRLAAGALAFAVLRAFAVRRAYPRFNLPLRALALGGVLLLFNALLPALFTPVAEKDTDDWMKPNLVLWYFVLPLLTAGANLLPRPTRYGGLNPERHWLPLFIYALWIAGTGSHIWCLGYMSKLAFPPHYLGPVVVVAAWTLWHRIGDCVPNPSPRWELAMLCVIFIAAFISFADSKVFESLVLLNAAAYAILFWKRGGAEQTLLREFLFASCALLLLGLPEDIGRILLPSFTRTHAMVLALAAFICLSALRWFKLSLGLAGAGAAMTLVVVLWPGAPLHLFVQTALVFLLAHSLGWKNRTAVAPFLRAMAGAVWIADAAVWMHHARWQTDMAIASIAIGLGAAWLLLWWMTKQRRDWIIFASSSAVVMMPSFDWLTVQGSQGLLWLAISLVLFAAGFVAAWTRHLWEHTKDTAS